MAQFDIGVAFDDVALWVHSHFDGAFGPIVEWFSTHNFRWWKTVAVWVLTAIALIALVAIGIAGQVIHDICAHGVEKLVVWAASVSEHNLGREFIGHNAEDEYHGA